MKGILCKFADTLARGLDLTITMEHAFDQYNSGKPVHKKPFVFSMNPTVTMKKSDGS